MKFDARRDRKIQFGNGKNGKFIRYPVSILNVILRFLHSTILCMKHILRFNVECKSSASYHLPGNNLLYYFESNYFWLIPYPPPPFFLIIIFIYSSVSYQFCVSCVNMLNFKIDVMRSDPTFQVSSICQSTILLMELTKANNFYLIETKDRIHLCYR